MKGNTVNGKVIDITGSLISATERGRLIQGRATMAFLLFVALTIHLLGHWAWLSWLVAVYAFIEFCVGVRDLGRVLAEKQKLGEQS